MKLTHKQVDALPVGTKVYYWRRANAVPLVLEATVEILSATGKPTLLGLRGNRSNPFSYGGSAYLDRSEAVKDCLAHWQVMIEEITNRMAILKSSIDYDKKEGV